METWQINHLIKYRPHLLETTSCSQYLLSHLRSQNVLGEMDLERIERCLDKFEGSALLYDIIKTRTNGYIAMVRALAAANQSGALEYLLEGFVRHDIPDINLDLHGILYALTEIFDVSEIESIMREIKNYLPTDQFVELYDKSQSSRKLIILVNDTIPLETPIYIPRSLLKRQCVNPTLFRINCPDVFVFKGISLSELSSLVKSQPIVFSSTQLLSLTSRFIILEHEEDWEEICLSSTAPAHLITHNDIEGYYILQETTGGSTVIYQYLHQKQNFLRAECSKVSEEEFIEEEAFIGEEFQDFKTHGFCICDSPGMGKTQLLASLARRMKKRYPHRLVAFIQLSNFIEYVMIKIKEPFSIKLDTSLAKSVLLEYLAQSHFKFVFLIELNKKIQFQLELFFDGFDEVRNDHIRVTKQLLSLLASLPKSRIFVTSRPNIRHELEAALMMLSYNIAPLNHAKQIDFLACYWKKLSPRSNDEKLREFAKYCVGELEISLGKNEQGFTGIPQQCWLVAEVFSRNATIFAQPQRNIAVEHFCTLKASLPELLKRYCDIHFAVKINANTAKMLEVKKIHVLHAMKLLFPEFSQMFNKIFGLTFPVSTNLRSSGVLYRRFEKDQECVAFYHSVLAAYLAAEYIAGWLDGELDESMADNIMAFLFKEVMRTQTVERFLLSSISFKHATVMDFLNYFCAGKIINPSHSVLLKAFPMCFTGDDIYYLVTALVRENYAHLFTLLNQMLSHVEYNYKASFVPNYRSHRLLQLINIAAEYSTVFFVEALFRFFRLYLEIDLDGKDNGMIRDKPGPLHTAAARLNYEMVQFFVDRVHVSEEDFLEKYVSDSRDKTGNEIQKMLLICDMILHKNKHMLANMGQILMRSNNVHVDAIKFMLRKGVNPREVNQMLTVVHKAAKEMSGEEFVEFCHVLIEEFECEDLFSEAQGRWRSPLPEILENQNIAEDRIQMIADLPTLKMKELVSTSAKLFVPFNITWVNDCHQTLLMSAAMGKRSMEMLNMMIMVGVNVMATDYNGNTFAHYIASSYTPDEYHEIVQMLIGRQVAKIFRVCNMNGQTPLHFAVRHLELQSKTLDLLAGRWHTKNSSNIFGSTDNYIDINAVDEMGWSVLHWAVMSKRSLHLVKVLVHLGADWSVKNKHNRNLAQLSASYGLLDHVKFFVELGCDINETDKDNNNALQYAIYKSPESLLEIVQFLVAYGAQKYHKNKEGKTAYMMALQEGINDVRILELVS